MEVRSKLKWVLLLIVTAAMATTIAACGTVAPTHGEARGKVEEIKLFCKPDANGRFTDCKFLLTVNMSPEEADDNIQAGYHIFNSSDSRINMLIDTENPTCTEATGVRICAFEFAGKIDSQIIYFSYVDVGNAYQPEYEIRIK